MPNRRWNVLPLCLCLLCTGCLTRDIANLDFRAAFAPTSAEERRLTRADARRVELGDDEHEPDVLVEVLAHGIGAAGVGLAGPWAASTLPLAALTKIR